MNKVNKFFSKSQKDKIVSAIKQAESLTSGEIRVHIENSCKGDVFEKAIVLMQKLKMDQTHLRNGVLIYLALENKQFAIIGDKGISELVPADFWDDIKDVMQANFRNKAFVEGLVSGIEMAGTQLQKHFPRQDDDVNELADEISFPNEK